MNEETRIKTPETDDATLNDEKLDEAAGGYCPPKSNRPLNNKCPICGRTACQHIGWYNL